jgi:predicted ester cyclase
MVSDADRELVRRFFEEVWNKGNLAYIDEAYSPDFVLHALWQNPSLGGSRDASGPQAAKEVIGRWLEGFPDMHVTIEEQVAEGDTIVSRHFASATHTSEFRGIKPTHKLGKMSGITITRVHGGKIVEAWTLWDAVGMMQQLGVMPPSLRLMAIAQRLGILKFLQRRRA